MLLTSSGATWVHTAQQRQTEMVTLTTYKEEHTHLYSIHTIHTAPRKGGKRVLLIVSEDILCVLFEG